MTYLVWSGSRWIALAGAPAMTMTSSTTTPPPASTLTLTASLDPSSTIVILNATLAPALPAGASLIFQYATSSTAANADWRSIPPYGSTAALHARDTARTIYYRALFSGFNALAPAVSNIASIAPAALTTRSASLTCTATRSYTGSKVLRGAYATTRCYHGQFDSTFGNQWSALWFPPLPHPQAPAEITRATLHLTRIDGIGYNGKVRIGLHNAKDPTYLPAALASSSFAEFTAVRNDGVIDQPASYTFTAAQRTALQQWLSVVGNAPRIMIGPPTSPRNASPDYHAYHGGTSPRLSLVYTAIT
jgi:hypothetical protein